MQSNELTFFAAVIHEYYFKNELKHVSLQNLSLRTDDEQLGLLYDQLCNVEKKYNPLCVISKALEFGTCRLRFIADLSPSNRTLIVKLHHIELRPRLTFADRLCGSCRIVTIEFSSNILEDSRTIADIGEHGVNWNNFIFHFLACKDPVEGDCFFIRLHQHHRNVSDFLQSIANFEALRFVGLKGLRAGLLVSGSCEGLAVEDEASVNITVERDHFIVYKGIEHCLTDGSGFISSDLAALLPLQVSQGQVVQPSVSTSFASVYQVRVFSSCGVFKGTLLVHHELPMRTIVLRESMRKVCGRSGEHGHSKLVIEVVNTSHAHSCPPRGVLNRHLVLLLHELGVPYEVFEDLLRYADVLKQC